MLLQEVATKGNIRLMEACDRYRDRFGVGSRRGRCAAARKFSAPASTAGPGRAAYRRRVLPHVACWP